MKLTGKCKEDFEYWLLKTRNEEITDGNIKYDLYYILPESCQNLLIIEWFDSVCILIEIQLIANKVFSFDIHTKSIFECQNVYKTRTEATSAAIEKTNELYNNL